MKAGLVSPFLEALGRVSAQAAVLVLLVLLAQWLFRRWLTPRWRCALWLLVVGRLLSPVSLPTPVSLFNLVPACASNNSPALHGVLRPRRRLPTGFTRSFSLAELHFVFLHELAHVKCRDVLMNWIVALLQVVHWFNPLLWFGFAHWRADRELACDALALETAGEGRNMEYGRTILRLLEGFTDRAAAPGLVGILEDKHQLQERIAMIAAFAPRKRFSVLATSVLSALALIGLTDAQTPSDRPTGTAKPAASPTRQTAAEGGPSAKPAAAFANGDAIMEHISRALVC